VLFVPVGGGPTLDGPGAAAVVAALDPGIAVPMHFATPAADFLGPLDPFLDAAARPVRRPAASEVELGPLPEAGEILVLDPPPAA
jgi:L-ascorbate metabolism protein UlaG (beta-lactamase superfamily)